MLFAGCGPSEHVTSHPPDTKQTFCEWYPVRNGSVVWFSDPLPIEGTVGYKIEITAEFQDHEGDFEYPVPLVCYLTRSGTEQKTTCPDYQPTDEEFEYDNIPNWELSDKDVISGFRWYRLVEEAIIRLTRDETVLFDGPVEFEEETSSCDEHVFDGAPDHPEYGERYRYAEATVNVSDEADTSP